VGGVIYVVCSLSPFIKTFSADTLRQLGEGIHVKEMRNPRDIVVCDHQLYVADHQYCIWRVSADNHSYIKWLPTESTTYRFRKRHYSMKYRLHDNKLPTTDAFQVNTLSVTSRGLLVTSSRDPPNLREYSTTGRRLLRHVKSLPKYIKRLYHGVEVRRDRYVISHQGTLQYKDQTAVSELFNCHHIMIEF